MKKEVFVLLVLLMMPVAYSLNLGTARGYVLNTDGATVAGTSVNITVVGCTGSGCGVVDITDSNGYFIQSNLNILPGNNVTVVANKSTSFGSGSVLAGGTGSVGVANINITMCVAPQMPALNAVSDSHSNSVVSMSWTTFKAGLEYDEFSFDGGTGNTSAISPQVRSNVAYQVHTWKVRTCSSGGSCCSDYATDSFETVNNLPASPTLIDQSNTNMNSLAFNWTHSGTDADGDTVTFDFQLDGVTTSNVTKPYSVSGISSGSHTWGVRACDGISCTSFSQDSFSITNSAASAPILTDQGHTSSTTLDLSWTNSSDPDLDTTHNEFQLSTDDTFNTIVSSDLTAVSPKTVSGLTTFTLYYWRVRTCDNQDACSPYDADSFFVFVGGNGTGTTQIISGGTKEINLTCTPQWECNDWGLCSSSGISTRICIDANECIGSLPRDHQFCSYAGPQTEKPSPVETAQTFFFGDLDREQQLVGTVAPMEHWELIYGGETHTITVLQILDNGVSIEIKSEPKTLFIPVNESVDIDINDDGEYDVRARIVEKNHINMRLEFTRLHEEEPLPISTEILLKEIQSNIRRMGLTPILLFVVILGLVGALLYQYKTFVVREIKIDNKVKSYIQSAKSKGFDDAQIRARLLANGFPEEEVDYVFSKIK